MTLSVVSRGVACETTLSGNCKCAKIHWSIDILEFRMTSIVLCKIKDTPNRGGGGGGGVGGRGMFVVIVVQQEYEIIIHEKYGLNGIHNLRLY